MPILHDAHVNAYYEAIDFEPWYHRDAYCAWLDRLDYPEGYEIF